MPVTLAITLLLSAAAPQAPRGADAPGRTLRAEEWINLRELRVHDRAPVVLFFFDAKTDRGTAAGKLSFLAQRHGFVVYGLTESDAESARKFVEKTRIRFPVGARARVRRDFKIEELPAIRVLRSDGEAAVPVDSPDDLLAALGPMNDAGADRQTDLHTLREGAAGLPRAAALSRLARSMDPAEFDQLLDELWRSDPDPWVRGFIEYTRRHGAPPDDTHRAPSVEAWKRYRANPGRPEFAAAQSIDTKAGQMGPAELLAAYRRNLAPGDGPLAARRLVVLTLQNAAADAPAARDGLLEIAATDSDSSIRLNAVMGLAMICRPGDAEVAAALAALADGESELLQVRPMMRYVAWYLETGGEDARQMPLPEGQ